MAQRGGARKGAGRKSKEVNDLRRAAASEILTDTIQKNTLRKLISSRDARVKLDTLKFLWEHKYGKAPQAIEHSGRDGKPIEIDTGDPAANEARIAALLAKAGIKNGDGS